MKHFTQVDNELIRSTDMDVYEKTLMIYFLSIGKNIYPSYRTICQVLKCSKPKAIKTVQSLCDKKYIEVSQTRTQGDYDNNVYRVIYNSEVVNDVDNVVKEIDNVVNEIDNGSKQDLPQVVNEVYPKNTNKRILNKEYINLSFIDEVIDKVKITQEQYDKLITKFNKESVHKNILALDNYIANGKGNKYKDHYRALNTWCGKENQVQEAKTGSTWDNMKKWG